MRKIYFLILCCALLTACKNPQRERLKELQDAANTWNIYNTCIAVVHTSMFLDQDHWREQLPGFCEYNISKMDSFANFNFQNDTLGRFAKAYVARVKNYLYYLEILKQSNNQTAEALQKASLAMDSLMQYAVSRYALNRFTPLREASYDKAMERKQYRTYKGADQATALKETDWRAAAAIIKHAAESSTQPNQKAVAWLDYADLYENNRSSFKDGEDSIALHIYQELAFAKDYHLYKFEAWRRWRCIYQLSNYGPARDAFIYNKFYDSMRFIAMNVVSNRLEDEPMDSLAINQYLLFATHGPILRYGAITIGNQVLAEYSDLFNYVPLANRPAAAAEEDKNTEESSEAKKSPAKKHTAKKKKHHS